MPYNRNYSNPFMYDPWNSQNCNIWACEQAIKSLVIAQYLPNVYSSIIQTGAQYTQEQHSVHISEEQHSVHISEEQHSVHISDDKTKLHYPSQYSLYRSFQF